MKAGGGADPGASALLGRNRLNMDNCPGDTEVYFEPEVKHRVACIMKAVPYFVCLARAGVILPKLLMFALVDLLTARRCDGLDGPSPAYAALPCPAAQKALAGGGGACAAAGGRCVVTRDGYYALSFAAVAAGGAMYGWLARTLPRLEALPIEAWRAKSRTQ